MDELGSTQGAGHGLQGDGHGEDGDGGNHGDEALGHAGHGFLEAENAAGAQVDHGEHQSDDAAPGQAHKGVGVAEGADEVAGAVGAAPGVNAEEAANIDHTDGAGNNQGNNGQNKIDDLALGIGVFVLAVLQAAQMAVELSGHLMHTHGAVVELHQGQGDDEHEGQQGVEVVGDGANEQLDAGEAGVQIGGHAGDGGGPGGDGSDHADGGGGGVNDVSQLGPGDLVAVGDGAHDGAHGQAVEVVVNEDQDAQGEGGQSGAHPGLDVLLCPAAESGGAAGGVDQSNDDAQDNQEQEDTGVIRNGGDKAVVEGGIQSGNGGEVCAEQSAYQHADEQGGVSLLGDEGQNDGQNGGHQRPESTVHFDVPPIKKS